MRLTREARAGTPGAVWLLLPLAGLWAAGLAWTMLRPIKALEAPALDSPGAVVDWVGSTALRPRWEPLDPTSMSSMAVMAVMAAWFVPLGVLLPGRRLWSVAVVSAGLSWGITCLRASMGQGVASWNEIAAATGGAVLGAWVGPAVLRAVARGMNLIAAERRTGRSWRGRVVRVALLLVAALALGAAMAVTFGSVRP